MQARPRRQLHLLIVVVAGLFACKHTAPSVAHRTTATQAHEARGLFWSRLGDAPAGMRVAVWLDSDDERVRGSFHAVPFDGDIEGRVTGASGIDVTLFERGASRTIGTRTRHATLRWMPHGEGLVGTDEHGTALELLRAGFVDPSVRTGVWIGRWTGLPSGMGVETRVTVQTDGAVRAVYQYEGTGGVRDGSFEGTRDASGVVEIRWTEIAATSGVVASGRGRLAPTIFGLRGTFGIEGSAEGIGEWTLEPLDP